MSGTIENFELGSITNKKREKNISSWDFERLSVCQTAGFAEAAGEATTAASEISFDNAALETLPLGKTSRGIRVEQKLYEIH